MQGPFSIAMWAIFNGGKIILIYLSISLNFKRKRVYVVDLSIFETFRLRLKKKLLK